jgi:hypothetical protein
MNAVNLKLVRGIFGALVVGALGFGATQALASPTQAEVDGCTEEQAQKCDNLCKSSWGPRAVGDCLGYRGEMHLCECGMTVEW